MRDSLSLCHIQTHIDIRGGHQQNISFFITEGSKFFLANLKNFLWLQKIQEFRLSFFFCESFSHSVISISSGGASGAWPGVVQAAAPALLLALLLPMLSNRSPAWAQWTNRRERADKGLHHQQQLRHKLCFALKICQGEPHTVWLLTASLDWQLSLSLYLEEHLYLCQLR